MAYDTINALIPAIKRRAMLPTTQNTYVTADFLAVLNSELQATLVPLLMSVREEYFVTDSDVATVVGQAAYDIPSGAIGGDLRQVQMVAVQDGSTRPLARFEPEQVSGLSTGNGAPFGFALKDEQVVLYPPPQTTQESLRLGYHRRPSTLVDASTVSTVFAATATQITLNAGSGFTPGSLAGFDVVKATPQFRSSSGVAGPGGTSGFVIAPNAFPANIALANGDYVCPPGQSPVPQIPVELHPILVLRAVCVIAEGLGDQQLLETAHAELLEKQRLALVLIANRTKGNVRKVPNGMNRWRGPWSGRWPY